MEHKNIVATIYIKDGMAVKSPTELENKKDVLELASVYDDSGIDKIICYDLSSTDEEHEKNILAIREINRNVQVKTAGGGNIKRLEDVKKLLYAGCIEVILNGSKPETIDLIKEASARFGANKMLVSLSTVDFLFKTKDFLQDNVHELLIMNTTLLEGLENITSIPYIVQVDNNDFSYVEKLLKSDQIRGISGAFINDTDTDIMQLKSELSDSGIKMDNFEPKLSWSDLKPNSDGLVPVVVQDFQTGEVLMLAYMNEESLNSTIRTGKMTYYSRSRKALWVKGETSGHTQYVKSLTADCDFDTILAKVSQVGVACHTGAPSCFFNEIVKKEYVERNPLKVFEDVYAIILDRKKNPKEGSYTNYLFDKGLDKILKKVGEEATEIVIAAKNPDPEETKYEISDFLYHMMVLMAEKGVTWEDITSELAQR
ncbi:phosphoribosyl-ATP pyrophosphatase /phosphoribosyl-AMP cyclohydrolase [Pseudobutyrivibrio ruminis]|jgi:phosphoribosyl-ATP pyrophosphohydrolase/phosphoribosyl-AMP cyclohydrolase|uniref:Histidine biosynthesis bifunctional protein HisIE n=2 Tax=Pseudobutyrivibrio ruminis TaxID=46206 RepID=A0A1H7FQA0_9FIRM|nr:bifunctional phosphoribosyl-AMP cyclohydrolase/phosphoribosyl-ATP diphosphatase HisIE [Pseudobutyrivibrio ruminis]SEK27964.1 phosphoribosyl-ATP pyrophosphatase /phosphoribosyl-AMP cyclohydrolase [Pseudobutyrivibrio ruminis]SOB91209.1 phosphoribosyl-ATP pyrophosphatase /phosphoribosyl-AMP cyclohydrolase [Pseudobutyrivibrio ruminis DSM 9787]